MIQSKHMFLFSLDYSTVFAMSFELSTRISDQLRHDAISPQSRRDDLLISKTSPFKILYQIEIYASDAVVQDPPPILEISTMSMLSCRFAPPMITKYWSCSSFGGFYKLITDSPLNHIPCN